MQHPLLATKTCWDRSSSLAFCFPPTACRKLTKPTKKKA